MKRTILALAMLAAPLMSHAQGKDVQGFLSTVQSGPYTNVSGGGVAFGDIRKQFAESLHIIQITGNKISLMDPHGINYELDLDKGADLTQFLAVQSERPQTSTATSMIQSIQLSAPRMVKERLVATARITMNAKLLTGVVSAVIDMDASVKQTTTSSSYVKGGIKQLEVRTGQNVRLVEFRSSFLPENGVINSALAFALDLGLRIGSLSLQTVDILTLITAVK